MLVVVQSSCGWCLDGKGGDCRHTTTACARLVDRSRWRAGLCGQDVLLLLLVQPPRALFNAGAVVAATGHVVSSVGLVVLHNERGVVAGEMGSRLGAGVGNVGVLNHGFEGWGVHYEGCCVCVLIDWIEWKGLVVYKSLNWKKIRDWFFFYCWWRREKKNLKKIQAVLYIKRNFFVYFFCLKWFLGPVCHKKRSISTKLMAGGGLGGRCLFLSLTNNICMREFLFFVLHTCTIFTVL